MERAGTKVVEFLESEFSPLSRAAGGDFLRERQQRRRWVGGGAAAEDAGAELAGGAGDGHSGAGGSRRDDRGRCAAGHGFSRAGGGALCGVDRDDQRAISAGQGGGGGHSVGDAGACGFHGYVCGSEGGDGVGRARGQGRESDCRGYWDSGGILASGFGDVRAAGFRCVVSAAETGREQGRLRARAGGGGRGRAKRDRWRCRGWRRCASGRDWSRSLARILHTWCRS